MKEPKDKAAELVKRMGGNITHAWIAVEEIIKVLEKAADPYSTVMTIEYWQEVRLELDKLKNQNHE